MRRGAGSAWIATVLLVDDEPRVTDGLIALLRHEPYEVLSAHSADQALSLLARGHVDVIVSDEHMPGMAGTDLLRWVACEHPHTARLLLTGRASLATAVKAINEGRICRLLCKPCPPEVLLAAIADAVNVSRVANTAEHLLEVVRAQQPSGAGHSPAGSALEVDRRAPSRFGGLDQVALASLSAREREVLAHIIDGQRVAQVARALFISPHTARNHLKAIFAKLDVHSQAELIARSRGIESQD